MVYVTTLQIKVDPTSLGSCMTQDYSKLLKTLITETTACILEAMGFLEPPYLQILWYFDYLALRLRRKSFSNYSSWIIW